MKKIPDFAVHLPDLALIEITGDDAPEFLHGQLTQDVIGLPDNQARLAGYCTAKGRLMASMVIWQDKTGPSPVVYALTKAEIAQALIKRLSMFVLRAKVNFRLAEAKIIGVAQGMQKGAATNGSTALTALAQSMSLPSGPWEITRRPEGTWITAPSADTEARRWWLVAKNGEALVVDMPDDPTLIERWHACDIAAGLPWVLSATQDLFIPQTLNLDLIDAVSFSKGCYPGQEVVARSHYRGTVKRRMAYGVVDGFDAADANLLAGTDTFDANKPDNPCGRIVNAAQTTQTATGAPGLHVLMEVQLADMGTADIRLERPDGPSIKLLALPYSIKTPD